MRRALKLVAAIVLVTVVIVALRSLPVAGELARFQSWVRGQGSIGYVIYALVYAICVVFLVPASLLTIGAGVIFGVVPGTLVVMAGATIGATLAFLLARGTMRNRVAGWAKRDRRFDAIDAAVARQGAKIVLLVRLSVVFPFTWVNYVFGLTGIRTVPYAVATFIGIAPATLAFVYIGAAAGQAVTEAGRVRLAVYVLGAICALAVSIYVGRLAAREIRRAAV